jgi:hypothetical protein
MSYVINVARKRQGTVHPRHIFRTAEDSITSWEDAEEIANTLLNVYPEIYFEISITEITTTSVEHTWQRYFR